MDAACIGTNRRDFLRGAAFLGAAAALPRAASAVGERPLLKVAIMSDVQGYPYPEDAGMRNLERALDVLSAFRPDVVVGAGDINDTGRNADAVAYYKARCDARLGVVPHVACMGNHEIGFVPKELKATRTPAACLRDFNAMFGYGPDEWVVRRTIAGYDFISLSLSRIEGYTGEEIARLKAAIDESVRRDATKPVFVVTHYHAKNTVNDSSSASASEPLRRLLDGYPQVVSLSGHTHNPLQDPRSIWQGSFTAVDTSTLCYGCITMNPPSVNQVSCLIPYGHESVGFMLLEIYGDRLVFRRFTARDRRELDPGDPWTVPWPCDPSKAPYAFERRRAAERAPQFAGDAEPTLWYDFGYIYLMFNAAAHPESVLGYRVEIAPAGAEAASYFQLGDYYRIPEHRQNRIVFKAPPGSLVPGACHRCRIYPVGFFGAEGRPAEWRFTTKPYYRPRTDKLACVQE
ncbi:MAG: metallophosphoesterase [Kiritimatiellae bacterium]|nr:metallophosphoesterase [Kiritimatiellia bacterium]